MARKFNTRSVHRYLALFIGLQLMVWSLSGLAFCWLPYNQVLAKHHLRQPQPVDLQSFRWLSWDRLLPQVLANEPQGCQVTRVEMRSLLGQPVYEVTLLTTGDPTPQIALHHGETGVRLEPISAEQAKQIALLDFDEEVPVRQIEKLEQVTSGHSEYREKELPAWQVTLEHPSHTTIYVSADRGVITARRNFQWRVFDFFWMLHTMDYQGRDNFNTWLLWGATLFSIASVASGFWLWWRTSRIRARWRRRHARPNPISHHEAKSTL